MSFADELRRAQARLENQKKQEKEKPARKRVSSGSGNRSAPVRAAFRPEDDIIALYLQVSGSSKFLIENYSKKRQLSPRAMKTRMGEYGAFLKKPSTEELGLQEQKIVAQFGKLAVPELQKVVISILRGEYTYSESSDIKTVRREDN